MMNLMSGVIDRIKAEERRLGLAILASVILALPLIKIGFVTSDATHHMFFARHYAESWFSLFETQIGGGINMATYPPLTYQIIAFMSFFLPLKLSYWFVVLSSWILLSLSASKFFTDYLNTGKDADWLVYLLIFFNIGLLKTVFVHGQMTTVFGLGFGFLALYFLNRSISSRKNEDFLLFGVSYVIVAFSHHFSFLLVSMVLPLMAIFRLSEILDREYVLKSAFCFGSAGLVTIIGIFPFIKDIFFGDAVPSEPIPHFTRQSLFEMSPKLVSSTFFLVYGFTGLMFLLPVYFRRFDLDESTRFIELYFIAFFFLFMGLGPTTVLPEIILGELSHWVTYDRFAVLSSIIFSGLFGVFLHGLLELYGGLEQHKNKIMVGFAAAFILLNMLMIPHSHKLAHGDSVRTPNHERQEMKSYIVDFLENKSTDYRYQTLGYGVPISQIYLGTDVPTLDSWYFSGRQKKWLANSGVSSIDGAGKEFLAEFMRRSSEESVKYIFTIDRIENPVHRELVKSYNWTIVEQKRYEGRILTVWENPENIQPIEADRPQRSWYGYIWGLLPPAIFVIGIFLLFRRSLDGTSLRPA